MAHPGKRARSLLVPTMAAAIFVVSGDGALAQSRPTKAVTVQLVPADARVIVDGQPREHPAGSVELRGPLGGVFVVEVVTASGARVSETVAVTDIGALPARINVPAKVDATANVEECETPYWWDASGRKHYKIQCLTSWDEPSSVPAAPAAPARTAGTGSLTVVCMPKCDQTIDNGRALGAGHVFSRPVPAGRHTLDLFGSNGVKKVVVVEVLPDQAREVRLLMDPDGPLAKIDSPAPASATPVTTGVAEKAELGFLNLAAYPWVYVSDGQRTICTTPCVRLPMAPGPHTLVLENTEQGLRQTVTVTIKSGEITSKAIGLK